MFQKSKKYTVLPLKCIQTKETILHILLYSVLCLTLNVFQSFSHCVRFWPHTDPLTSVGGKVSCQNPLIPCKVKRQGQRLTCIQVYLILSIIILSSYQSVKSLGQIEMHPSISAL